MKNYGAPSTAHRHDYLLFLLSAQKSRPHILAVHNVVQHIGVGTVGNDHVNTGTGGNFGGGQLGGHVPNKALRFTPEEPLIGKNDIVKDCESEHKVWTREGTTFTAHPVEIGITNGISTEIISGVAEGTRVVTEATIGGMPGESMEAPTGQEGGERSPFMPGPPGSKKKK